MNPTQSGTAHSAASGFPTVGILGGGQLGRMLALAAARLGIRVRFFDPAESGPSIGVGERFVGAWDDSSLLRSFVEGCDVITLENEWARTDVIESVLPPDVKLWPSHQSLSWISDKIVQKRHAVSKGIPAGEFRECHSLDEVREAAQSFGFPVVLKRTQHGYDGYGNATAGDEDELRQAYERLGKNTILVEAWVPFVRELSVIVARRADGVSVTYPVALTRQRDHRCEAVEVPAPVTDAVAERAATLARAAANAFEIVGLLAVEIFELPSGELLLNEVAPRPHNSGHFATEACATSQFENHLRAILGWPLGETHLLHPAAVMVNILGERDGVASAHSLGSALEVPQTFIHIYGKRHVRPNRKMGHVTAIGDQLDDVRKRAYEAARRVTL